MEPLNFWVVGGDARQIYLAEALAGDGHFVHTYALGGKGDSDSLAGAGEADCVLLPLPAMGGELLNTTPPMAPAQVLGALAPGQLVLAGQAVPSLAAETERRKLTLIDYFVREELAVANAVPSSEGAIQIAMEELPTTLHGARVLVIGAGRIGKVLAQQLRGLRAHVTLAARKPADLAWGAVWGCEAVRSDRLEECPLGAYDLVINTVPASILGWEELGRLKAGCLVIDLASAPGGTDFAAAEALGVRAIHALGLPGRVAPATAALAIKAAIYNILTELGV